MKAISSWSGGKDSCYATYKAIQEGFEIQNLLTMMQDQNKSNFHMISRELLDAQSEALNIPIIKQDTTPKTYEQQFKKALKQAKTNGVQALVTGDIFDVAQHEPAWLERICNEVGIKPIKPLWKQDTTKLLQEFINLGFKATVVRVKKTILGMEYLGRTLDQQFYNDLLKLGNIDLCGEYGEYHTFDTDGPIFKKRIEIQQTKPSSINGWGHLEITRFQLKSKTG